MSRLQGTLQTQVMHVLWELGAGTVERVRDELPAAHRSAYTTVQTVMNRLADRGLLDRRRTGKSIEYRPRVSEAEYVSGVIRDALANASREARQAAIVEIIGRLDESELGGLRDRVSEIGHRRKTK